MTLGKKILCHHVTPAATFLSQSVTISSTIQLDVITEHRLYQIVTKIIGFQLAGEGGFDIIVVDSSST